MERRLKFLNNQELPWQWGLATASLSAVGLQTYEPLVLALL